MGVNLTAHIHLLTKLGMHREMPRFPHMPSLCAQRQVRIKPAEVAPIHTLGQRLDGEKD